MMVMRGHLICKSDYKHPETGKPLYTITELKQPTDPPLLTTVEQCKKYIMEKEPYDVGNRIDAWGRKRKDFNKYSHKASKTSAKKMESYYGRFCAGYET